VGTINSVALKQTLEFIALLFTVIFVPAGFFVAVLAWVEQRRANDIAERSARRERRDEQHVPPLQPHPAVVDLERAWREGRWRVASRRTRGVAIAAHADRNA
jgi:hypothetical protein